MKIEGVGMRTTTFASANIQISMFFRKQFLSNPDKNTWRVKEERKKAKAEQLSRKENFFHNLRVFQT